MSKRRRSDVTSAGVTTKSSNEVYGVVKQRMTKNFEQMRQSFITEKKD